MSYINEALIRRYQNDHGASVDPSVVLLTASSFSGHFEVGGGCGNLLLSKFLEEAGAGGPRTIVIRERGRREVYK